MRTHIHLAAALFAGTLTYPAFVFAKCTIAMPDAQLCQSGASAAVAYFRQTPDTAADPATAKLLVQSRCKAAGADTANMAIREIARGPIRLAEGISDVVSILVDGTAYWYIAAGYLQGVCDR